jgi:hypothetical protein
VQIDPIKPTLKPSGTKRLKLKSDGLLSTSAFKFSLRRYTEGSPLNVMLESAGIFLTVAFTLELLIQVIARNFLIGPGAAMVGPQHIVYRYTAPSSIQPKTHRRVSLNACA